MGGVINIVSIKEAGAMAHPNSCVGIFWAVPNEVSAAILLDHRCSLNDAEPYGGMLTCGHGHHEIWEQWRRSTGGPSTTPGSLVSVSEYEEWPRGRIVYDWESRRFIIYADAQILRRLALVATLHERFGLPRGRTEAKRDNHYRGARRLVG